MDTLIKKSVHVALASASLFGIAATEAGMLSHEFSVIIDTQTTPLFNQALPAALSLDGNDQDLLEGANGADPYSLQYASYEIANMLDTQSHLHLGSTIPIGDQVPALALSTLEFAILPTHELFAASFYDDSATGDAGDGSMISVPLIGPIPEPSIIWLMAGALITLAGLSGGTRIHESV